MALGYFNVKHPDWGYPKADGPARGCGNLLIISASHCSLTPRNLRASATASQLLPLRPRCTLVQHRSLGSDHYVLTMQVCTSPCKPRPHVIRHTDWDAFRARRQHSATPDIEDLSQWTDQLLVDLDGVTASIPTTANHPAIDSRLAHLQAAHSILTKLWNKQRHNRRLRRRIAALNWET
ncbi:hypothetical protein HPB52_022585 [Rhipicephalus sanguineus]|uniref:Tick transposon n=1 Tax=Rhipicephalus sanguineus TaxID=34632 RepID=A0A9D4PIZ8_RHISA|nr:hypothetical protein HPB52_022585 [Rhipicephalus sanguineus]